MGKRDKEPCPIPADVADRVKKTLARYQPQVRALATPARAVTPPPQPAPVTPEPPKSTPLRSPQCKRARPLPSLESLPSADALPELPQFAAKQGMRHIDTQSTLDAGFMDQMSQLSICEASGQLP